MRYAREASETSLSNCRVSRLGGRGRGFEVEVEVKKSRSRLKSRGRGFKVEVEVKKSRLKSRKNYVNYIVLLIFSHCAYYKLLHVYCCFYRLQFSWKEAFLAPFRFTDVMN